MILYLNCAIPHPHPWNYGCNLQITVYKSWAWLQVNDLCIKAKARHGSVKQLSFNRAVQHFFMSNRSFAVTTLKQQTSLIILNDTIVKLLSLKRKKEICVYTTIIDQYVHTSFLHVESQLCCKYPKLYGHGGHFGQVT